MSSAIGRALARLANKNALYTKTLGDTQSHHINVHKGTPKDKVSVPVIYVVTTTVFFLALNGCWDMLNNQNRKVE